jgi:hypothetical protein
MPGAPQNQEKKTFAEIRRWLTPFDLILGSYYFRMNPIFETSHKKSIG